VIIYFTWSETNALFEKNKIEYDATFYPEDRISRSQEALLLIC